MLLFPLSAAADPVLTVAALAPYIGGTAAALAGTAVSFIVANAVSLAFIGIHAVGGRARRSRAETLES